MIHAAYVYHHSHILWTSPGLRALRCVLVVHIISTYPCNTRRATVLLLMKEQHQNKSRMPFEVVLLADVLSCQMKNLELVSAAVVLEVLVQHKLTIVLRVVCLLLVSFLHFLRLLKIL